MNGAARCSQPCYTFCAIAMFTVDYMRNSAMFGEVFKEEELFSSQN